MAQNRWVLGAVLVTSFLGPFMGSSINIAIPAMAREFGHPAEQLSWVVTSFLLGSATLLLPFGKLGDIIGRKRLFRQGLRVLLLMTLGCALAGSVSLLIVFRLLQGIALAMIFSTGMAMLVSSHEPQHRGRIIGFSAAATYIGLSAGPVVGGLITQYLGWRMIFFVTAAGLLLSLTAIGRVTGEWRGLAGDRLDRLGSFLYSAASGSILFGLSASASQPAARALIPAGIVLFVAFLFEQRQAKHPLVDWQLFRRPIFAFSNLAALIHYSATYALGFLLSLYLQLIRGFDAANAGLLLLLQPAMMALFSPLAGSLSDRLEPRLVASAGMAMTSLGLVSFSLLAADTPLPLVAGNLLFVGVGFAFFSSPNSNAIMGAVEPSHYGVAAAILAVMRIGGQAVSMAVVTVLLAMYTPAVVPADSLTPLLSAIRVIFRVLAVFCLAGVFVSLARGRRADTSSDGGAS